jgi:hypothetical protein
MVEQQVLHAVSIKYLLFILVGAIILNQLDGLIELHFKKWLNLEI